MSSPDEQTPDEEDDEVKPTREQLIDAYDQVIDAFYSWPEDEEDEQMRAAFDHILTTLEQERDRISLGQEP